jgi:hypothetical protein
MDDEPTGYLGYQCRTPVCAGASLLHEASEVAPANHTSSS